MMISLSLSLNVFAHHWLLFFIYLIEIRYVEFWEVAIKEFSLCGSQSTELTNEEYFFCRNFLCGKNLILILRNVKDSK